MGHPTTNALPRYEFWASFPEIVAAWLFGSAVTGRRGPEPDLDFAILLEREPASGSARMNLVIQWQGRLVDELRTDRLDVVILNGAPLGLCHQALRYGRLLYCRDHAVRVDFETRTSSFYCDTEWLRELFGASLKRRLLERGAPVSRRTGTDG
ncbi:MAG: DNA polymerase beta domain-containing protein [bacterium]|nr:MAG: DNA polymerase beta domain-containing protein [bacterium]